MPRRTTPSPTRCEWPGSETGRDLDRLRRRCLRGQTAAAPACHRRRSLQAIRQPRWASAQPPADARTGTGTPITAGDPRRPSAPAMHPSPWRRPGGMTNCERHRRSAGQSAGTNTRYARPGWHRVAPQMPSRSAALHAFFSTFLITQRDAQARDADAPDSRILLRPGDLDRTGRLCRDVPGPVVWRGPGRWIIPGRHPRPSREPVTGPGPGRNAD